jgi:tripartite-type tricarboxylate transporter receptor subunit TctC
MTASPSTPQELTALMREDIQRWADVVKATGIKPE